MFSLSNAGRSLMVALGLAVAAPTYGVILPVSNPSFESVQNDQGGWTHEGNTDNWSNHFSGLATSLVPMANADGNWYVGVSSNASIGKRGGYQQLDGYTFEAGYEYTLEVAVGRRGDHDTLNLASTHWGIALGYFESGTLTILDEIDGMIFKGEGGVFHDVSLVYTADAAAAGKTITVVLFNWADTTDGTNGDFDDSFSQAVFDNVRLGYAIPEPASAALIGLGAMLMLSRRRR